MACKAVATLQAQIAHPLGKPSALYIALLQWREKVMHHGLGGHQQLCVALSYKHWSTSGGGVEVGLERYLQIIASWDYRNDPAK